MLRKAYFMLSIVSLFQINDIYGQFRIEGVVTDSLSIPIPYVQVILYDSTNTRIVDFTQCDSAGTYQLPVEQPGRYHLAFNILSHKPANIPINLTDIDTGTDRDTVVVIDVILSSAPIYLDEVVVQSERSIRVSGDTVAMKVDDFLRCDEEVVEDVLSVLPGFDVDDDGVVRFAGKPITKVMVEGSDLFGKGYSMVTKNLDAGVLDEVQVLQNYLETPELKDLKKSDDVAINLSLKEEVKMTLFGNALLGINSSQNYEARLILTSLTKKVKQYLFFNSNSLGNDPLGNLDQFTTSNTFGANPEGLTDLNIDPWNDIGDISLPLDAQRIRFNNSGLASYNTIYKPHDNFEFKAISIGTFDKDRLNRLKQSIYLTEDVVTRDLESFKLTDKVSSGFFKVESTLKPNDSSRLEYGGSLKLDEGSALSDRRVNEDALREDYDNRNRKMSHYLNYTNRLNDNKALILSASYNQEHLNEDFLVDPLFIGDSPNLSGNRITGKQEGFVDLKLASLKGLWLTRTGKNSSLEIEGKSSIAVADSYVDFRLADPENMPESVDFNFPYTNYLSARVHGIGAVGRYALGEVNFFSGLEAAYLDHTFRNISKEDNASGIILIKPKIGFDWSFNQNKIQASYLYDASLASLQEMMDGYVIAGNRTINKGLGDFHMFRGHNIIVNYTYGGWLKRNMLHSTLLYNKNNGMITGDASVNQEYSLVRNILSTDREIYLANMASDFLLPSIRNNLKLSGSLTVSNQGSFINNEFYSIETGIKTYGFNFRSVFDGIFNYTFGASWLHQDLNIDSRRVKTKQFQYVDLYFNIHKSIKFQVVSEREVAKQADTDNTTYLIDAFLYIQAKPNKLTFRIEARNILNDDYFVSNSLTGLRFTSTRYELIPRYVLLSLNYRL